MTPEYGAVVAAVFFAASQVTTKLGLEGTTIVGAVLISMTTACATLAVGVVLVAHPQSFEAGSITLFAISGLVSPGIAFWANTIAIDRLGPSTSAPIAQSTRPLLSVVAAVLVLGETLSAPRIVGSAAIILGGWGLATVRINGDRETPRGPFRGRNLRPGFLLPVLAGSCHAAADIGVKSALGSMSEPVFGALIGLGTALVAWSAASIAIRRLRGQVRIGPGSGWAMASGVFQGLAMLSLYTALDQGDVSLVSPIIAVQPLAVFMLSGLFLRRLEGLRVGTVIAGATMVVGTIIVSL